MAAELYWRARVCFISLVGANDPKAHRLRVLKPGDIIPLKADEERGAGVSSRTAAQLHEGLGNGCANVSWIWMQSGVDSERDSIEGLEGISLHLFSLASLD